MRSYQWKSKRKMQLCRILLAGALVIICSAHFDRVHSFQIKTDIPDLRIRWDNTIKYNAAWRLNDASDELVSSVNQDDGNRNFDKGLISNRINLFSELDVVYRRFGARASGAAWYDTVYNTSNDNDSPATVNHTSTAYNEFTEDTQDLHGRKVELLDAFAFGSWNMGRHRVSFRAGRHTLLWGESLFFGSNGIAAGQSPVDIQKAQSVPGTPFKELIRPVTQVSGQVQVGPNLTVGAYYQIEWQENRLPAVGSYFSGSDVVGEGGERLIAGAPILPGGEPLAFFKESSLEAENNDQYGVQLRFRLPDGETDFGLYAIHYHAKSAQIYIRPSGGPPNVMTGQLGTYQLVYPQDISAYGVSFSRTLDLVNLAGEVSTRFNTPLISTSQTVTPGTAADNDDNPLYAVGESLHAQVSAFWSVPRTPLFREATLLAEVAWNRRLKITKNETALDPNTDRDAWGLRFVFTPTYRQVLPGLDLGIPLGLGYNPQGRSSVIAAFNNSGADEGGDMSMGLNFTYLNAWKANLRYTHYFGSAGNFLDDTNARSFDMNLKDRDFVSIAISRTF